MTKQLLYLPSLGEDVTPFNFMTLEIEILI